MSDHEHHAQHHADDATRDNFCQGMPMTMSMSGFQRGLKGGADCLTYLFPHWKLDERGKYQGAMVYTFLLAILCEYLGHLQGKIRKSTLFIVKQNNGVAYTQQQVKQQRRLQLCRKLIMTLLYGTSQCLGWSLMLISMTFSVELFVCVVLGTVVGKVAFPTAMGDYYGGGGIARTRANRQQAHGSDENLPLIENGDSPDSQQSRRSSLFRRRRV